MNKEIENAVREANQAAVEAKEARDSIEKSAREILQEIKKEVRLAREAVGLAVASTNTSLRIAEYIDTKYNKDKVVNTNPATTKTIKEINEELSKIRNGRNKLCKPQGSSKCPLNPKPHKPLVIPKIPEALTAEQIEKIKAKLKEKIADSGNQSNESGEITDSMKDGIIEDLKGPIEIIPIA